MSFPRALHQMHCSPRMSFTKTWKGTDWLFKDNPRFVSDIRSDLFHLYDCEREKKEHENKWLQVRDSEINMWKSQLIVTVGKPLANGLVGWIWPRRGNDCTVRVYNWKTHSAANPYWLIKQQAASLQPESDKWAVGRIKVVSPLSELQTQTVNFCGLRWQ